MGRLGLVGSPVLMDAFKRTGKEADGQDREWLGPRILRRKGQDKRRERGLGASVVGGSSMEPSRDKGQGRLEEGIESNGPGQTDRPSS